MEKKIVFFVFGVAMGILSTIAFYSSIPLYKDTSEMGYWRQVEKTKGKMILVIGWEPDMGKVSHSGDGPIDRKLRSFGQYNVDGDYFPRIEKPRELYNDIQSHRTIFRDGKRERWDEFVCRFYQDREQALLVRNFIMKILNQVDKPWLVKEEK